MAEKNKMLSDEKVALRRVLKQQVKHPYITGQRLSRQLRVSAERAEKLEPPESDK